MEITLKLTRLYKDETQEVTPLKKHKHQWRKVAATLTSDGQLITTKKKCISCGKLKIIFEET